MLVRMVTMRFMHSETPRFSLLIRIKVGFQVTGAFYLETIQWGVGLMPLTLALRDRGISVNSSPARLTQ